MFTAKDLTLPPTATISPRTVFDTVADLHGEPPVGFEPTTPALQERIGPLK